MASEIHVGDIGTQLIMTVKDDGVIVDISSASGKRLAWLLGDGFMTSNALKFGFTWQVGDSKNKNFEAWHLQFVCGDKLPQAVVEAIAVFPTLDAR